MKYFICIFTAITLAWNPQSKAAEAEKPNILFIFCDDLGYGDLGVFHQNERAAKQDSSIPYFTTPHIDAMAKGGIMFDQHYCGAPVCAPSRATLLGGQHQGHSGRRDNQFDQAFPDTNTLASVVKEAGYATAAFGKWGLQGQKENRKKKTIAPPGQKFPDWSTMPMDRGFDYFFGYVRHRDGHYHYPVEDKKQVWENKTEVSKGMELCFTTDLFTAATKKWIIEHTEKNPKQPFFAYLAYDTPHAKLQNPPSAYPNGGGLKGGVQWLGKNGEMINTATGKYDAWMHPDYATATWDHDNDPKTAEQAWPDVQRRYANNVRRIDDTVGDLMTLLKDLNIAENTLVIFSSDNGPSQESYIKGQPYHPTFFHGFGPFDGIKRDMLEGGLRVPTIAHWPAKIAAGSSTSKPSGHWDWLPTFTELSGLPSPASSDGVSLMPTLTGLGNQQDSTIYSEYAVSGRTPKYDAFDPSHRDKVRGQMQVIIIDGHKGLRTGIKSAEDDFEIYDLQNDPKEINNLASKKGFDEIQAKMKARVLQMRIPHESAKRPYDNALIPAADLKETYIPGTLYHVIPGNSPWMPSFQNTHPVASQPQGFKLPKDGRLNGQFAIQLEAAVMIPADGRYTFTVESDHQTMLFVHDIRLLDEMNDSSAKSRSASLSLKSGWHPVRLLYRSGKGTPSLSLKLQDSDGKAVPLNDDNVKTMSPGW